MQSQTNIIDMHIQLTCINFMLNLFILFLGECFSVLLNTLECEYDITIKFYLFILY